VISIFFSIDKLLILKRIINFIVNEWLVFNVNGMLLLLFSSFVNSKGELWKKTGAVLCFAAGTVRPGNP
jgi:hypothetical protein